MFFVLALRRSEGEFSSLQVDTCWLIASHSRTPPVLGPVTTETPGLGSPKLQRFPFVRNARRGIATSGEAGQRHGNSLSLITVRCRRSNGRSFRRTSTGCARHLETMEMGLPQKAVPANLAAAAGEIAMSRPRVRSSRRSAGGARSWGTCCICAILQKGTTRRRQRQPRQGRTRRSRTRRVRSRSRHQTTQPIPKPLHPYPRLHLRSSSSSRRIGFARVRTAIWSSWVPTQIAASARRVDPRGTRAPHHSTRSFR